MGVVSRSNGNSYVVHPEQRPSHCLLGLIKAILSGLGLQDCGHFRGQHWPAAGFVVMWVSWRSAGFEFYQAEAAQFRGSFARVVEALDLVEHFRAGVVSGLVDLSCSPFGFQKRKESVHHRPRHCLSEQWRYLGPIPDIASSAHRTGDAVVGQRALELVTGVLRPLVPVLQQRVGLPASPDGHHQGVHDQ